MGVLATIYPPRTCETRRMTQWWPTGMRSKPRLCVWMAPATKAEVRRSERKTHGMLSACLEPLRTTVRLRRCKHRGFRTVHCVPASTVHDLQLEEDGRWQSVAIHVPWHALACLDGRIPHVGWVSLPAGQCRRSSATRRPRPPAFPNGIRMQRRAERRQPQRKSQRTVSHPIPVLGHQAGEVLGGKDRRWTCRKAACCCRTSNICTPETMKSAKYEMQGCSSWETSSSGWEGWRTCRKKPCRPTVCWT
mmetsp:Transcript_3519/g.22131  ORF Transcript_3519/g.22131 Transcript_3519/m.22131 type:complete len:248 (+) Transcript_3519:1859-2602(+)